NLWIGTNGGGLLYLDRATGRYRQYRHDPRDPNSLANDIIVSLHVDRDQHLWIGTYFGGLDRFDGKTFTHYRHDPQNPNSLADDRVWEIFEDSRRNLWIGTLAGGLDRLDRQTGIFHHHRANEPNSIHTNYVAALVEDRAGNLWVGTGYGLEVRDPRTGRFTHYLASPEPGRLSNNNVFFIHEDSRGLIWIGTQEGLNLFDRSTKTFRVFRREEGLPDNSVLTILEDDRRHLWLSTPRGLSHLQISRGTGKDTLSFRFVNYDRSDGLQGDEFNENAALRTRRGELVFGGGNGFNLFRPDSLGGDHDAGRVVLTGFQLFNRNVAVGETVNGRTLLPQAPGLTGEVVLKPGENVFSVEFAALNFLQPEKVRYSYLLEGFTDEWLAADEQALRAPFTNLNPGEYTFRVRATAGGKPSDRNEARLRIVVLPPFWKTKTALLLYLAGIIGALLLARRMTLARARMNFRLEQERQEARRMHELDLFKIKFFTNVSHEFRTPLSLIITPLEKLTRTVQDPDLHGQLLLIHRNARRLLNLVNQLLDFRKMEEQDIRLQPVEGDIVQFVKDLTGSFSDISEKKRVRLTFEAAVAGLHAFFDPDKLEKILFNLLSNAFKFTPEGGTVSVQVDVTGPGETAGPDQNGWVWI
ncbi:MAG: hybrid sensor histidine kinase/response regulator, partial [Cytophagales bacterium]|nr:hybrid sensor histidine kinase/response regulator [Cytophagales bacterium]